MKSIKRRRKNLTNKEKLDIIQDMVIIVDSRENKWQHIEEYFKKNKIKYRIEKLDVGDYTFELPNYSHLKLDNLFLIERKGSLDELAGNFTKGRERFKREFERMTPNQKIHLLLENFTWRKLLNGSYRSKFSSEAYKMSILTWCIKYDFKVWNVVPKDSGEIIYSILVKELDYALNKLK